MSDYDVIIVGAGHNGLTAGVELARSGYRVVIVEKTYGPGGMAATRELFPGFKHSVGAWALLVFREEMIKYLELDQQGFELIRPESSFTVFGDEDDTPFIAYTDPVELANHLVEEHGFDAMDGFQQLGSYLAIWKDQFDKYLHETPPTLEAIIAAAPDEETREALKVLNHGSAMAVLRRFFPEEGKYGTILGSLCASAIDGTHKGPFTGGSAASLSYHYCAGDNYDFKIPKGGIGSMSHALENVFRKYGGEVRYKTPIEQFLIEDGVVEGVTLKDGEQLRARTVISTLDAHSTFIRLMDKRHLPGEFVKSVEAIEYTNGYIQIHLAIDKLPHFTRQLAFVNDTVQSWLVAYIRSPEQLEQAWNQFRQGQVPDDPAVYCYFPSQLDPSLAPEGYHTCTLFAHYFPAHTPKGEHKAMKNVMTEKMLNRIESVAPGFKESIIEKAVFTQHYFERNFGATAGDFAQGLLHPGQMFGDRMVPDWADYHTPIERLFVGGGGCHPGPGVTCLPGLNSARAVKAFLEQNQESAEERCVGVN